MYVEYVGTDQGPMVASNCMDSIPESKVLDRRIQDIIINDGPRKTASLLGVRVAGTAMGNSWDSLVQGICLQQKKMPVMPYLAHMLNTRHLLCFAVADE